MAYRFVFTLLFFLLASVSSAESPTLQSLRADLASGSLKPVLARQALLSLPDWVLTRGVQDTRISRFAITGFNENSERFAARVRLHFVDGGVGFLRLEGVPGHRYRLTDWYDYSSGLQLSDLVAASDGLTQGQGKAFLRTLNENPGSEKLGVLAGGKPALLALWLAQCNGQPCEAQAMSAQTSSDNSALWQLKKALAASSQDHYRKVSGQLHVALGDDPYLWWLEGQLALENQRCHWAGDALRQAWQRHSDNLPLADVALQCYLRLQPPGTDFLNALSEALGADTLAAAIRNHYQQQGSWIPAAYQPWLQPGGQ